METKQGKQNLEKSIKILLSNTDDIDVVFIVNSNEE